MSWDKKIKDKSLNFYKFIYDSSSIVIDPKNWNSYAEFLVKILDLTSEKDQNKILKMEFTDELNSLEFLIKNQAYKTSFIKLFFIFDINTQKNCIYYYRSRTQHTLDEKVIQIEYQTFSDILKEWDI